MGVNLDTVLQVLSLGGVAIWAVASVKSTTKVLSEQITNLANAVNRLGVVVEENDKRTDNHEVRISVLENRPINL